MNKKLFLLATIIGSLFLNSCNHVDNIETSKQENENVSESITIDFENNGYLKQALVEDIRNEQIRIKAISAYEYALPIVGMEVWNRNFLKEAQHGNWLIYDNWESKAPILTANATTPYVISFVDLASSNYYIEIPGGPIGGLIIDIYQSPMEDLGILGPDAGKGGKYLLIGPSSEIPVNHDADYVVKSKSNLVFLGTRIIGLSGEDYRASLNAHKLYKVGESSDDQKFIQATKSPDWTGNQSRGLTYWEDLDRVLQNEPVVDRNRFILTQLREAGIEKGKKFSPNSTQKKLLIQAEEMGNAMAMVNTFSRESYKEKHWQDRNWLYILNMDHLNHIGPNFYESKEIASYTYEAFSTSKGMVLNNVGKGSKYLGAYIDENKEWLDGKNTYEILIPRDAPANQFWSITVYDNDTRCLIQNQQKKSDISSAQKSVKQESDGSTKVYVGPEAPEGYENNWIQSNPEKGFFVYMRLYGPLESYFDKTWKMPDVKMVN